VVVTDANASIPLGIDTIALFVPTPLNPSRPRGDGVYMRRRYEGTYYSFSAATMLHGNNFILPGPDRFTVACRTAIAHAETSGHLVGSPAVEDCRVLRLDVAQDWPVACADACVAHLIATAPANLGKRVSETGRGESRGLSLTLRSSAYELVAYNKTRESAGRCLSADGREILRMELRVHPKAFTCRGFNLREDLRTIPRISEWLTDQAESLYRQRTQWVSVRGDAPMDQVSERVNRYGGVKAFERDAYSEKLQREGPTQVQLRYDLNSRQIRTIQRRCGDAPTSDHLPYLPRSHLTPTVVPVGWS
jgi:hypothetical protein